MSPTKHDQIMIGRAKNALLSYFEQRLSVPKIYLDADWEGAKVDALAIDRAGVGDVSIALIVTSGDALVKRFESIKKLHTIPAHFKYLALASEDFSEMDTSAGQDSVLRTSKAPIWFADDGVGRIGHLLIDLKGERPNITVPISAERFRSNQHIYDLADAFASSHTADFEVRESSL
jgi:hypothetical protein